MSRSWITPPSEKYWRRQVTIKPATIWARISLWWCEDVKTTTWVDELVYIGWATGSLHFFFSTHLLSFDKKSHLIEEKCVPIERDWDHTATMWRFSHEIIISRCWWIIGAFPIRKTPITHKVEINLRRFSLTMSHYSFISALALIISIFSVVIIFLHQTLNARGKIQNRFRERRGGRRRRREITSDVIRLRWHSDAERSGSETLISRTSGTQTNWELWRHINFL